MLLLLCAAAASCCCCLVLLLLGAGVAGARFWLARGRAGLAQCYVQILPKIVNGLYMVGFLYGSLWSFSVFCPTNILCMVVFTHGSLMAFRVETHCGGWPFHTDVPWWFQCFPSYNTCLWMAVSGGDVAFCPLHRRHLLNRCPMVLFKKNNPKQPRNCFPSWCPHTWLPFETVSPCGCLTLRRHVWLNPSTN